MSADKHSCISNATVALYKLRRFQRWVRHFRMVVIVNAVSLQHIGMVWPHNKITVHFQVAQS